MISDPIAIEGVSGPVVVTSGAWSRPVVTVGGVVAPRTGGRLYALPTVTGEPVQALVRSGFGYPFPTVEVNGVQHRTGPKIPIVLQAISLLPIVLLAIGGLLGGLVGGTAVLINQSVLRRPMSSVAKAAVMIGIGVLAYFVLITLAAVFLLATGQV
ncbi:hypothetical protein [Herbidospora sp. RD11066]